jgi:hypothetical protein
MKMLLMGCLDCGRGTSSVDGLCSLCELTRPEPVRQRQTRVQVRRGGGLQRRR